MKRYSSKTLILIILITLLSTNVLAASNNGSFVESAIADATASITYSDWLEGSQSTLDISISNISTGAELSNGVYAGWCIQPRITGLLHNEPATLYSSLNTTLPSSLSGLPWGEINYVLNHKIHGAGRSDLEFHKDVQTAIWILLGDPDPEFGISPEAQLMVDNAKSHADYVPGNGDIVAVIVYSDGVSGKRSDRIQETIIEVELVLPPTPTPPTKTSTPPTGTATPPTETSTPPTGTATPPTETSTPPTGTATPPTETSTPPTGTVTPPTETSTPPNACQPIHVVVDFSTIANGASIEGMGVVAPNLNIDAKGTAVKIAEGTAPPAFGAPNFGNSIINGGINPNGGFSDLITKAALQAHQYTFTFAPGTAISKLSLHMLDFGDLNPSNSPYHYASFTAFDANNNIVSKSEFSFLSDTNLNSPQYGYLGTTGDAIAALPGQPGNWTWNIYGSGITKVILDFGTGYDPNIAFDTLSFCPSSQ